MVDTISSTKGIRHAGSATTRYGASPATASPSVSERAVAPVAATGDTNRQDQDGRSEHDTPREYAQDASQDLRLEIAEDESGAELVYRFVDAHSGDIIREWNAGEFGKLRDYMRDKKIHLLDKKI